MSGGEAYQPADKRRKRQNDKRQRDNYYKNEGNYYEDYDHDENYYLYEKKI